MQKNRNYKWCIVPLCKNTTTTTPEKCFIQVPKNDLKRRKLWIKQVRREPKEFSMVSTIYVCEDHFDLETDMENFIKWKMMKGPKIIKKEVVPHKFECQKHSNLTTITVPTRKGAEKRKILNKVQKALDSSTKKSNLAPNNSCGPEVKENNPGSSVANLEPKYKDVGVTAKPHVCNKHTQTEFQTFSHNVVFSSSESSRLKNSTDFEYIHRTQKG